MRTTLLVAILTSSLTLTACGGESPTAPDAPPPDAPPDAPLPTSTVSVETEQPPSLIAFRDVDGPWQTPRSLGAGTFEADVHGPYFVIVVCDDGLGNITTWNVARSPKDERDLFLPCFADDSANHLVQGRMVQAGRVSIGFGTNQSTTPNWDFTIPAFESLHDLVAVTADRIAIRRGLLIDTPTTVTPQIDVAQEGTALVALPLAATNATPDEVVTATISLVTQHFAFARVFRGDPAAAKLAPDALLGATDRQSASVSASQGAHSRTLRRNRFSESDAAELTLPDALGPVQFTTTGANLELTWSTLPEHDLLDATLDAFSDDFTTFWFTDFEISPQFVLATAATSVTFDADIPGYKPEWRIDLTKEYSRALTAFRFGAGETASSGVFELANAVPRVRKESRREAILERRTLARERR